MVYYTNDNRKVEFIAEGNPLGKGTQGIVYDYDVNKCIKIYFEDASRYSKEMFDLFKKLSLKGYAKLYDLLYSSADNEKIVAYIMEKYTREIENILTMPTEYTIDSFNTLYNSVSVLTENNIIAKDTIPCNAVLGKDGITLIDFESSNRVDLPKEIVREVNINNILYLFRRLFEEELKRFGKDILDDDLSNNLDRTFAYSSEPVKALKRKLAYCKTPMESLPYKYRY